MWSAVVAAAAAAAAGPASPPPADAAGRSPAANLCDEIPMPSPLERAPLLLLSLVRAAVMVMVVLVESSLPPARSMMAGTLELFNAVETLSFAVAPATFICRQESALFPVFPPSACQPTQKERRSTGLERENDEIGWCTV